MTLQTSDIVNVAKLEETVVHDNWASGSEPT